MNANELLDLELTAATKRGAPDQAVGSLVAPEGDVFGSILMELLKRRRRSPAALDNEDLIDPGPPGTPGVPDAGIGQPQGPAGDGLGAALGGGGGSEALLTSLLAALLGAQPAGRARLAMLNQQRAPTRSRPVGLPLGNPRMQPGGITSFGGGFDSDVGAPSGDG